MKQHTHTHTHTSKRTKSFCHISHYNKSTNTGIFSLGNNVTIFQTFNQQKHKFKVGSYYTDTTEIPV